jgi:hypothetical protein
MDTLTTLASLALVVIIPIAISVWIRRLGGLDGPTSLAGLLEPVAKSMLRDPSETRPIVREGEPVRWRFGPTDPTAAAAA